MRQTFLILCLCLVLPATGVVAESPYPTIEVTALPDPASPQHAVTVAEVTKSSQSAVALTSALVFLGLSTSIVFAALNGGGPISVLQGSLLSFGF